MEEPIPPVIQPATNLVLGDFVVVRVNAGDKSKKGKKGFELHVAEVVDPGAIEVRFLRPSPSGLSFRLPIVEDMSVIERKDVVGSLTIKSTRRGLFFFGPNVLKEAMSMI
jgi:hypothetical protein